MKGVRALEIGRKRAKKQMCAVQQAGMVAGGRQQLCSAPHAAALRPTRCVPGRLCTSAVQCSAVQCATHHVAPGCCRVVCKACLQGYGPICPQLNGLAQGVLLPVPHIQLAARHNQSCSQQHRVKGGVETALAHWMMKGTHLVCKATLARKTTGSTLVDPQQR